MKKLLLGLFAVTVLFTACGEDDCELTTLDEIIIGEWKVLTDQTIEFRADGTIVDDENFFDTELNEQPLNVKTYTLQSDTLIVVETANEAGDLSLSLEYTVNSYDCNEMNLEFILPIIFERK